MELWVKFSILNWFYFLVIKDVFFIRLLFRNWLRQIRIKSFTKMCFCLEVRIYLFLLIFLDCFLKIVFIVYFLLSIFFLGFLISYLYFLVIVFIVIVKFKFIAIFIILIFFVGLLFIFVKIFARYFTKGYHL